MSEYQLDLLIVVAKAVRDLMKTYESGHSPSVTQARDAVGEINHLLSKAELVEP